MTTRNSKRLPMKLDSFKLVNKHSNWRERREFTRLAHKKQRQYNHKLCREAA